MEARVKATEDRLRALMIRGLDGESAAHRELLTELAVLLRGFYARRLGGESADAEDLVQETLIAVHTRRESYDRTQPLTAWAFAMARYKLIDHFRRSRLRRTLPLDDAAELVGTDDSEDASAGGDLERLLADLPAKQREVIRYVRIEGLSVTEAAERSGLSSANVKVSVHRGLRKLMGRVQEPRRDED